MKKAIIFDLDGTLINSLPDISAAMNRSLEKFGLPTYSEKAYQYKVGNGVRTLSERCVGDRVDLVESVMKAYMADYAENCMVNTYAYKGVPEMLRDLLSLGIKVCVLSNKDQADVESVLRFVFPDIPFTIMRGRVEGVKLKPDPEGALLILNQLSLSADECWYVGDTGVDMQCGNSAGMETIGLLWGYRPREELVESGALHLAATPEEVTALVRNA